MTNSIDKFLGKFQLTKSENFDEYMKKIGVGFALRQIGKSATPVITMTQNGDEYNITSATTFKTVELKFKLGVEFEETTPDGRKVKTTITMENGKLVQRQKAIKAGDKESEIIREIDEQDELVTTLICEDVKCVRVYERLQS